MITSTLRLVILAAALGGLSACARANETSKGPAPTSTAKVTSVDVDGGKQTVLLLTSRQEGGLHFTRLPYDLNGAWRIEGTVGIYTDEPGPSFVNEIVGLEADRRGATQAVTEFYGLSIQYDATPPERIQVFAYTHGGSIEIPAPPSFPGARVIDMAIETDGVTVTFLARDHAVGGAYTTVATRPLQTPGAPHQAGFGMFRIHKGAAFGFSNFRIPTNGDPAAPVPAAQAALNSVYEAALQALEAGYALDGPVVGDADVAAAQGFLDQALVALAAGRAEMNALEAKKAPKDVAIAAADKAKKELEKAKATLTKKGPKGAKPVLKAITKKLFAAAHKITDAIIPDDLRASLPGQGL